MKLKVNSKKLITKRSVSGVISALALCVTLGTITHKEVQAQGIQNQLNSVFNSMSHTTSPGVFETQRRGVITGGRYTLKNKIFNDNIVSFVPPSYSGSCNGIDIFGGSFSFINSEQLIALLRSVAANAAGYAFQLALDNICPQCNAIMSALQRSIQSLNEFMGNSCQLAKGIVNDTFEAFGAKKVGEESFVKSGKGMVSGFFDAWANLDGETPGESIEKNDPENKTFIGNVVWKQLTKNSVKDWYNTTGDTALLEALMSISGSLVVHPHKESPDATSGSSTPSKNNEYTRLSGYIITLRDLVEGGKIKIYDCSADTKECMKNSTSKRDQTITGLKQQIEDVYLGKGTSAGFISKYVTFQNLTESEKAIVSNMPKGVHVMIQDLARNGSSGIGLAESFILDKSGSIALIMAYNIAKDLMQSVRIAVNNEPDAWKEDTLEEISVSERKLYQEFNELIQEFGPLSEVMQTYNTMMQFDSSNIFVNYR